MPKLALRTKSVGTKVSDDEYVLMESEAAGRDLTLSEWCREVLLASVNGGERPESTGGPGVLAEVRALRAIVLNLFYDALRGEAITEERMDQIIQWADQRKQSGNGGPPANAGEKQ
jgi:hypothetical protein